MPLTDLSLPTAVSMDPGDISTDRAVTTRRSVLLLGCYALWFLVLGDPHWFLASQGLKLALKLPTALMVILVPIAISKGARSVFPPFLVFTLYTALSIPFAYIRGNAILVAKLVAIYYALAFLTLAAVRTGKQAMPIVLWALLGQYTWWAAFGAKAGLVWWDEMAYANYDGYGPLMTLGIGASYFMAMAAKSRKMKFLAFATAAGCILGLVSAYARGAVVCTAVVAMWAWMRSKHKLRSMMVGVGAAVVLYIAGSFLFVDVDRGDVKSHNIWQEMMTIADTGGTRGDREVLWSMATTIYLEHPVFGVGPGNFGAYAADNLSGDQVGGDYHSNPATLWGRQLHNTYYQILSEFGTVGMAIFLWLLWDFWRRNRALRRPARIESWARQTDGALDLHNVSLALEAAMLGFVTTGWFYNTIFGIPWFYALITVNLMLFHITRPGAGGVVTNAVQQPTGQRRAGWRTSPPFHQA